MGYRRHYAILFDSKNRVIKEKSNNDGDKNHAEMRVLKNIDRNESNGGTILIVRQVFDSNGNILGSMSKPCKLCMKKIQLAGIKRIIYSTDNQNNWEKIIL